MKGPLCALAAVAFAGAAGFAPSRAPAPANAEPPFLLAWIARYPSSTLPTRIAATTGSACCICHDAASVYDDGNCYRNHLRGLLHAGYTIEDAIDLLDGVDSDGDGVTNGVEINAPRLDQAEEVGYDPGLVGPDGVDLCSADPPSPGTGQLETPPLPLPCYVNCDASTEPPILNVNDFLCFMDDFSSGNRRANCDGSTVLPILNINDFLCFMQRFAAGCP